MKTQRLVNENVTHELGEAVYYSLSSRPLKGPSAQLIGAGLF